jgi:hypothetical protein
MQVASRNTMGYCGGILLMAAVCGKKRDKQEQEHSVAVWSNCSTVS